MVDRDVVDLILPNEEESRRRGRTFDYPVLRPTLERSDVKVFINREIVANVCPLVCTTTQRVQRNASQVEMLPQRLSEGSRGRTPHSWPSLPWRGGFSRVGGTDAQCHQGVLEV